MANDFIPRGDADFNAWQVNFVTYANANLANLGSALSGLTPIITAQPPWTTRFAAHVAAQANAQAARATKNANHVETPDPGRGNTEIGMERKRCQKENKRKKRKKKGKGVRKNFLTS